jgi:hypothetical protein
MINKENKYKNELFELLKDDLSETIDSEEVLNLLREVFITDTEDIKNDEIIEKLTRI